MTESEGYGATMKARGIRAILPDNPRFLADLRARLTVMRLDGMLKYPWNVALFNILFDFLPAKRSVRQ